MAGGGMTKRKLKEPIVIYSPSTGYKRKDGYIKFVSEKITELLERKEIEKFKLVVNTTTNETVTFDYRIPNEPLD